MTGVPQEHPAGDLFSAAPLNQGPRSQVRDLVRGFLHRAREMEGLARKKGTPVYLFEAPVLRDRARSFLAAFNERLPAFEAFFAVKCSNHPLVAAEAVRSGLGLEVSSGIELKMALETGCRRILFSGPGKTARELDLAAEHHDRVTVLMDSFAELDGLQEAARRIGVTATAGVRLTTQEEGLWRKFGIPLSRLRSFLDRSAACPNIIFKGLQFHTSWNLTPEAQVGFIHRLGGALRDLDPTQLESLGFLDIGGGYWPSDGEWLLTEERPSPEDAISLRGHRSLEAAPIDDFAREISRALHEQVFPLASPVVYAEPGRWIVNDAMHILIRVADRKADDLVIADAGTNIVGWERYETDYVPVINLSRPSLEERPCLIAGSLCTPHDVWGWSYFGDGIEPGDVLLLPRQGAYTWSLRQHFIKPAAEVVQLTS